MKSEVELKAEVELKSEVDSEAELPKRLRLSDAQLKKIHERGHRSVASQMRFFRSVIPAKLRGRYAAGLEVLKARLEAVVARCKGCSDLVPRVPQGTKVPRSDLGYLDRVWLDVLTLDRSQGFYALGCIDDCTGDLALQFMQGHGASEVQDMRTRSAGHLCVGCQAAS